MTVIITMAGKGSRFADVGYTVPKHRIIARGHTLFYWSMLSLAAFFKQHFIFACLDSEDINWIKAEANSMGINNISFHLRTAVSQGQAETAYDALHLATAEDPLWIYNIDTYVANLKMQPTDLSGCSGCIHVVYSNEKNMSFVKYDENGFVNQVAEKLPISSWATIGLYGFDSADEYKRIYETAYNNNQIKRVNNELYIAPMYEILLRENKLVCAPKIAQVDVFVLGTPEQLIQFDPLVEPPYGAPA